MERIAKKSDEYYERAWNDAKKAFESNGFAASGVGTFVDAKNAYKKPPSFSPGKNPAAQLTPDFAPGQGFINLVTGEISGNIFKV